MELPEKFRTRRLLLTRFAVADAGELAAMHRDPRVVATLGGVRPAGEIETLARTLAAQWSEHGFGWWTVREPGTGRFIGRGGLRYLTLDKRCAIEVGFGLIPEYWGRGLATELARVAVAQGIVRLGASELVSITLPDNATSRRVMEKAGFGYEREAEHAGMAHVLYRVTAQAWRSVPAAQPLCASRQTAAAQAVAA